MIKQFTKPNRAKLIIFFIFLVITFGGYAQGWVFGGKNAGSPKPLLFDLLAPFPFWSIWVLLLIPLALMSELIVAVGGYGADFIMRGPFWLFAMVNFIYFYILSCLIIFTWIRLAITEKEINLSQINGVYRSG